MNNLVFNTAADQLLTTVTGTVTVSALTGTVTVSEITNPVTIGNTSLTVSVTSYAFTSDVETVTAGSGTGQVFDNTDISNQKVGTFFIYNTGAETLTISLQVSPTTTSTYYIDDPSYSAITVAAGENTLMVLSKFANYARLQYTGATSTDFEAYYNFQT